MITPMTDATRAWLEPVKLDPSDRLRLSLDTTGDYFLARITRQGGGYASNNARRDWPKLVIERKEVTTGLFADEWLLAATDITVAVIEATWSDEAIIWDDEEAKIAYDFIRLRAVEQERHMSRVADWKANPGEYQPRQFKLHDDPSLRLAKYQQVGLESCYQKDQGVLFMEQGTGKTPIVVTRVCNEAMEKKTTRLYRTLIIAPKNVRSNWANEFKTFGVCPGQVTVVRGGDTQRMRMVVEAMIPEDAENLYTAVVMSYESATGMIEWLRRFDWDLIVWDESHYCKAPWAKRTKAMHQVRDFGRQRMILTGTPICNHPLDLWAQWELLGHGSSGFIAYQRFRQFHAIEQDLGDGVSAISGVRNVPFLQERFARQCFVIRKEEVMPDLPDKVRDIVEVEMTADQADVYRKVATQLCIEIENELNRAESGGRSKSMVVNNILTKLLRLAQITSGHVVWDPVVDPMTLEEISPKIIDSFDPNPKLEELVQLLENKGPNDKTIIWAVFQQDIKSIASRLKLEGHDLVVFYGGTSDKDRETAVERFNCDPKCKIFIGNQAAGGTGLNLLGYPPRDAESYETNCNHVIYFSQGWSSPQRSQSEDRAHRRGTRAPVRITDLVIPSTVDEEIRARVTGKQLMALQVSDIRAILAKVLR